jgi:hypothetical protein
MSGMGRREFVALLGAGASDQAVAKLAISASASSAVRTCAIAASNHALAGDGAKFKSSSFLVVAPAAEAAD